MDKRKILILIVAILILLSLITPLVLAMFNVQ